MRYSFTCYGHENITAKHKTTLEFTKDNNVSLRGDCIVCVNADFSLPLLKEFIKNKIKISQHSKSINKKSMNNKSINQKTIKNKQLKSINKSLKNELINKNYNIKIIINTNNLKEEINGFLNLDFNDENEIVARKSDFRSERTLIIKADKAASGLSQGFVDLLRNSSNKINVVLQ